MPIVATHLISGVLVTMILYAKFRNSVKPRRLWLAIPFLFVIPDIDHLLYWRPGMLGMIYPLSLGDLFAGMFGPRPPSYLHSWLIPLAFFVVGIFSKVKATRLHWIFLVAAVAWAAHMLLDGVMLW